MKLPAIDKLIGQLKDAAKHLFEKWRPQKKAKENKASGKKTEKNESNFMRSIHGQRLLVDFYKVNGMYYDTHEHWVPLNEATVIAMGYIPAMDYKTGFGDILTKTYVKFNGFVRNPCVRIVVPEDGRKSPYEAEVETMETASTLYDYFASDAQEMMVESMRVKKTSALDTKKLILIILIVAVIGMAAYFFMQSAAVR